MRKEEFHRRCFLLYQGVFQFFEKVNKEHKDLETITISKGRKKYTISLMKISDVIKKILRSHIHWASYPESENMDFHLDSTHRLLIDKQLLILLRNCDNFRTIIMSKCQGATIKYRIIFTGEFGASKIENLTVYSYADAWKYLVHDISRMFVFCSRFNQSFFPNNEPGTHMLMLQQSVDFYRIALHSPLIQTDKLLKILDGNQGEHWTTKKLYKSYI